MALNSYYYNHQESSTTHLILVQIGLNHHLLLIEVGLVLLQLLMDQRLLQWPPMVSSTEPQIRARHGKSYQARHQKIGKV
jgi:hypothetical protein